ncbi:MAG: Pecanex-like protein 1 [Micromonosporaceae bacterium]|nr:Pecanex-like protein 1 [Micromonosporaceae bacterium]
MHRPTQRRDALRERVFAGRQQRSVQRRRAAAARRGGRRMTAVLAGLAMVSSVIAATQLASNALEGRDGSLAAGECLDPSATPEAEASPSEVVDEEGNVHHHYRSPGTGEGDEQEPPTEECDKDDGGTGGEDPGGGEDPRDGGDPGTVPPGGETGDNNGLEILGRDCTASDLPLHTGFQSEQAQCVNTQAGDVTAPDNNPSLLITDFPDWVEVDQPFTLTVSTRNLLRDRFLGAGDGGYYLEASYLTEDGIQRGHFHTGCVNLQDGQVAPTPATLIEPQFFAAVEDGGGGGGAGADAVSVEIPGLTAPGLYRCTVWAGDGSHRIPMMSFAREQPPVDAVRITVTAAGEQ